MSITREPSVAPEIGQLMNAFGHAADGFEAQTVLNASLHMLAAAIGFFCKQNGMSLAETEEYASSIADLVLGTIRENWNREKQPGDVEVKSQ